MKILLAIFIGGGLGSLSRFGLSIWLINHSKNLPVGTLVSNILASTLLGLVVWLLVPKLGTEHWLVMLLGVGFCGAFSTFSTFSLETVQLLQFGQWFWAAMNILISVISCLLIMLIIMKSTS